ncbi:hypothetical protein K1719_015805 [Acacia pycnantha]|nr:hypothetical protein K1719_015805 [Acacia pycnantha]
MRVIGLLRLGSPVKVNQNIKEALASSFLAASCELATKLGRLNKLLFGREKYLQLTEMVEDEKIDITSTVIDEDVIRRLRTSPIHSSKDRTTIDDFEIIKPIRRGALDGFSWLKRE